MAPEKMIDLTGSDSEASIPSDDGDHDEDDSSSDDWHHDEDASYKKWQEQLLDCLDSIFSSGDFSVSRQYQKFVNPCLRIAGHAAVIPLPVTDHDAERIRGACKEAPFGRGDETLVDTSVRKTWELDATHFQCTNPSWPAFLRTILDDVATGLGLPDVRAKPHKLLLYEKGSFFKRHKDSEKEVGMIATLVICLPAEHRGGAVQLSFGAASREIATAPASPFDVTALAWFSDVDHEIKPLTFGHRLVLTYKLFQSGGVKQSAQFLLKQSEQLKSILGKWRTKFPEASMLAYPLEHKYTKSSLSLKNMKGRDRAVCHSLKEMSAPCGLYLALAHMTHTEDEDYGDDDGEMSTMLETIYSCDGAQIGSDHSVDDDEILGFDVFKDRAPDSEDEGEFTGNESAPSSFRYHDTVALLIPKHQIRQLLRTGLYTGLGTAEAENLISMVQKDFEEHRDDPVVESSTLEVMATVLGLSSGSAQATIPCTVAKWALETNHEDLYQKALRAALSCKEFPSELLNIVAHFLEDSFTKNAEHVDWAKWLSPFLHSTSIGGWSLMTKMFTARLSDKALKKSFRIWSQSQLDLKFENRASFIVQDHDFFVDRLGQDAISEKIVPALAQRGTPELIFKVLETMSQRRAQYSDNRVRGIYEETIETACSRLLLQTKDFPTRFMYNVGLRMDESRVPCQRFTALIEQSLTVGATGQALRLIGETHKVLSGAKSSWDRSGIRKDHLVQDLLAPLASALHSHGISYTPGVIGFFELLIRDVLHYNLPEHPKKLRGWRHKRRGCEPTRNCADCNAMNAFLEAEDQKIWSFSAAEKRRKHVDIYLPHSLFKVETTRTRSPYTLVVQKLGKEYSEEVKEFFKQLQDFERVIAPLKGDIFENMLGDATYRELILLEKIKMESASEPVAGVKRPSESTDAGLSVRQRVI